MGFIDNMAHRVLRMMRPSPEEMAYDVRAQDPRHANEGPLGMPATLFTRDDYGLDNGLTSSLAIDQNLMARYVEYESMDDYGEISTALDIFADHSTIPNSAHDGKVIWPEAKNKTVQLILEDLFDNRLKVDDHIWEVARNTCKYGETYAEMLINSDGVVGLNMMPTSITRKVLDRGMTIGYVESYQMDMKELTKDKFEAAMKAGKYQVQEGQLFSKWEIAEFRLRGKNIKSPYGLSVLDSARWVWRRLVMFEDSALVHKLTRSPSRFAFYVNVGNMSPEEAQQYLNDVRRSHRKRRLINPRTGALDFKANPLAPTEDFYMPVRGDGREETRIDVISGPDWQSTEDLEYFRSKLFSSLKVPKAYLGMSGDPNRATLMQEDVNFARSIINIQRALRNGYRHICRVHLACLGIDPDTEDWDVKMPSSSSLFEQEQLEVMSTRLGVADSYRDWASETWIKRNILKMPVEEIAHDDKVKTLEKDRELEQEMSRRDAMMKKYPGAMAAEEDGGAQVEESLVEDFVKRQSRKRVGELKTIHESIAALASQQAQLIQMVKRNEQYRRLDVHNASRRSRGSRRQERALGGQLMSKVREIRNELAGAKEFAGLA